MLMLGLKTINYDEHEVAPGQAKCESCLPKGQAGIPSFFFKPCGRFINKNLCLEDIAGFGQVVNQA